MKKLVWTFLLVLLIVLSGCKATSTGTSNSAPNTPGAPSGPIFRNPGKSITFSAATTDPDDANIAYQFDWDDGNLSNWSNFIPSGDTVSREYSYDSIGVYGVKVRAKDTNDNESEWSSAHEVEIDSFLFYDEFEDYSHREYPTSGGWYNLWSGTGDNTFVVRWAANSGDKSFQLTGYANWTRTDGVDLDLTNVEKLTYKIAIAVNSQTPRGAYVGFFEKVSPNESRNHNGIIFNGTDSLIYVTGQSSSSTSWMRGTWYSVKVEIDFNALEIDAWVNGTKIADNIEASPRETSNTFSISTQWQPLPYTSQAFFDDIGIIVSH